MDRCIFSLHSIDFRNNSWPVSFFLSKNATEIKRNEEIFYIILKSSFYSTSEHVIFNTILI